MNAARKFLVRLTLLLACSLATAQEKVKHIQTASPIATAVWAGDALYVSGQVDSPIAAADPAKGAPAVYGDTEAHPGGRLRSKPLQSARVSNHSLTCL
jgi:hypothetical protein